MRSANQATQRGQNGRTGSGHVSRVDCVTPEADPSLTGAICVVERRVAIIKGQRDRRGTVLGRGAIGCAVGVREGLGRGVIRVGVGLGGGIFGGGYPRGGVRLLRRGRGALYELDDLECVWLADEQGLGSIVLVVVERGRRGIDVIVEHGWGCEGGSAGETGRGWE